MSFLLKHLAVGVVAAIFFGLLLLWIDLAGLRGLLLGPAGGPLALFLFFFGLIVTFGGLSVAAAVIGLGQDRN